VDNIVCGVDNILCGVDNIVCGVDNFGRIWSACGNAIFITQNEVE
jgi:hypothetical protein